MRQLPLLVLLYVFLDFANPLMPGAVRFEAGGVQSVQADRVARSAVTAMRAPAAARREDPLPPGGADGALGLPVPAPARPRPVRRDVRRVASAQSDPSPSPTEDH